ncbi:hypothetical protein [Halomonas litopenaei]|uniref:hypothetical protein n=1 Tax=Halomonas litopenaei TaxID=2109328 RepID=UPI001A8EA319|nr:hypothetical protein [Halomonas litopenaei]MBN8412991.1 hypothetical protein [Halomonas litopenaei]
MEQGDQVNAKDIARTVYEWARRNGALALSNSPSAGSSHELNDVFDLDADELEKIESILKRVKITAVVHDEENLAVSLLCKNAVSSAARKKFPSESHGIKLSLVGKIALESNPPVTPSSTEAGSPIWFSHNGSLACGSSVTAATDSGAGTLGFLATRQDGTLVGVTNNHVTGGCNHTPYGMHIMSPAPFDAIPGGPEPTAIGKHSGLVPILSGDPGQIHLQELDVAVFDVTKPDMLSSMQGEGLYDTPVDVVDPSASMRVKKVGRTTGLRTGIVLGRVSTTLSIPYKSSKFNSLVHFDDIWAILGDNNATFSEPGDSGSLVVSEDGQNAVGLIFAGGGNTSFMIPVRKVLDHFNLSLTSQHNAEGGDQDDEAKENDDAA